jgi:hypothetical protein
MSSDCIHLYSTRCGATGAEKPVDRGTILSLYRKGSDIPSRMFFFRSLLQPEALPAGREERLLILNLIIRTLEDLVESPPRLGKTPEENRELAAYCTTDVAEILHGFLCTLRIDEILPDLPRAAQSAWDRLLLDHAPELPVAARVYLYSLDFDFRLASVITPSSPQFNKELSDRLFSGICSLFSSGAAQVVLEKSPGSYECLSFQLLQLLHRAAYYAPRQYIELILQAFPPSGERTALGETLIAVVSTAPLTAYLGSKRRFSTDILDMVREQNAHTHTHTHAPFLPLIHQTYICMVRHFPPHR